jgi:hypothetical protein
LARALQLFVPITAAGQRWILTSFPFNKPQSRLDLHLLSLHLGALLITECGCFMALQDLPNIHNL